VAVSDLTYTGTWATLGSSTALLVATSSPFADTADGVTYTVTTGVITSGAGTFSYTSTDAADRSGSGTATASTNSVVGNEGLTINFGIQSLASGSQYRIRAGTQSASAFSLSSSASGAAITPGVGTVSPSPAFIGSGSTIPGGGPASAAFGASVGFLSAAPGTGEGTYTVVPGVALSTDSNSWAQTYSASVQYTIASGP
jgi:hypothetical protein